METDLIALLRQREIMHPTRIAAVEVGHRELRVTIDGNAWWREDADGEEGQIVFSFNGIGDGLLDPQTLLDMEESEALEVLRVSPLSEEQWADRRTSFQTYCSEPLPQPLKLYTIVEDYLWKIGAPRTARDFLNMPDGSLSRFCAITSSNSFLLATAPQAIHELVLAEVRGQNVRHNVLRSEWPQDNRLYVEIGGSSFVCERATAEM